MESFSFPSNLSYAEKKGSLVQKFSDGDFTPKLIPGISTPFAGLISSLGMLNFFNICFSRTPTKVISITLPMVLPSRFFIELPFFRRSYHAGSFPPRPSPHKISSISITFSPLR